LQCERPDDAWAHFNECLRIHRHVYQYARSSNDKHPIHLEVSCVLHQLGCVGFAQGSYATANEMFYSEREILVKLEEASLDQDSTSSDRIHQARLTNLTWLKKVRQESVIASGFLQSKQMLVLPLLVSLVCKGVRLRE
jgi:hypothetical protein